MQGTDRMRHKDAREITVALARSCYAAAKQAGRRASRFAKKAPGIEHLRSRYHWFQFSRGRPSYGFYGVYDSLEHARRFAPAGLVGYDHDRLTNLEISGFRSGPEPSFGPMDSSEYPLLFWLKPLIKPNTRIFDFGGFLGNGFYLYRRYLDYPPTLTWTVCDVAAIARAGRTLAERWNEKQLEFTTEHASAEGADIFLAAGSLQYLEPGFLKRLLAGLRNPPKHVFVHRTPLHESRSFITLQTWNDGQGPVFCPYSVPHRDALIEDMRDLGYREVDRWSKPRALEIPLHPEHRVDAYSGLYFRRDSDGEEGSAP